jgi:enamine deaminase RidA (YjgF/YER057c/UK114 family)
MAAPEIVNPPSLPRPSGFSYAVRTRGELTLHLAGHTGVDAEGRIVAPGDIVPQFEQALRNLRTTVEAAGLDLSRVVKLTLYVTDAAAYQEAAQPIGAVYRSLFGSHYPAMTLVEVRRLWDEQALIEIDGVAVG